MFRMINKGIKLKVIGVRPRNPKDQYRFDELLFVALDKDPSDG